MILLRRDKCALLWMIGLVLLLAVSATHARAQQAAMPVAVLSNAAVEEDTNLEIELHVLVASNTDATEGSKLPNSLGSVVKRLRATLPFESYRLSTTMVYRVRNGGRLGVQGVGPTPFSKVAAPSLLFSDFRIDSVKLKADATGQNLVELLGFKFGARIPIQTGSASNAGGPPAPIIQYEGTGISTDFSLREGEPVVVGTLNVGQTGESFILVIKVKRAEQQ